MHSKIAARRERLEYRLIAGLATVLLVLMLVPAASTQNDRGAVSPATDTNSRLAKLEQQTTEAKTAADIAWMLTSSALVLMMTGPGLALVLCRAGA